MKTTVKLPAVCKRFTASYSKVEKPTGIEYILLTVLSMKQYKESTWGEALSRMGIQEDVYDVLFKRLYMPMMSKGMIEFSDPPRWDSPVNRVSFTEAGSEAFRKGVVATNFEEIRGEIAFLPAENHNKYIPATRMYFCDSSGFEADRFERIESDDLDMDNCINDNKKQFGVDEADAEIFDIRFDETTRVCYERDFDLQFDGNLGRFRIVSNKTDINFLKGYFNCKDFISADSNAFRPKENEFQMGVPEDGRNHSEFVKYVLPSAIRLKDRYLVLSDGTHCVVPSSYPLPAGSSSHLIVVDKDGSGSEYRLVKVESGIEGLDGSFECVLFENKAMTSEEVSKTVKTHINVQEISTVSKLQNALDTVSIIKDVDYEKELVLKFLTASDHLNPDIREIAAGSWKNKRVLPEVVEDALLSRGLRPDGIRAALSGSDVKISGTSIAMGLLDTTDGIDIADALFDNVTSNKSVANLLSIGPTIADIILNGSKKTFSSRPLISALAIHRALRSIMDILCMKSPADYSFDLGTMPSDHKESIMSDYAVIKNNIDEVDPFIRGSEKYSLIKGYIETCHSIATAIANIKQMPDKIDNLDDRSFGIILCIDLENILKKLVDDGGLKEMLDRAHEQQFISDSDYDELDRLRNFRNGCAHELEVGSPSKKDRDNWVRIVKSIKPKEEEK